MLKRQRGDQDGGDNVELTSPHEHVKNTHICGTILMES